MSYDVHPAFRALYAAYTGDPDGIGPRLNALAAARSADEPLIVATGSDVVVFPGGGRPLSWQSFRLTTRGFTEITAVSHLGVAVPYLAQLRAVGDRDWTNDALRLIERARAVRAVSDAAFWRDAVAVAAWTGREAAIADLVDYACATTIDLLTSALDRPALLDHRHLREHFLDATVLGDPPVAMNETMAATFALVSLDNAFRIMGWLRAQAIDWSRVAVLITGRAGRPTAGVTWATNSMCHMMWRASAERLAPERVYVAPHAPALTLAEVAEPAGAAAAEARFRQIWASVRMPVEMGRLMYDGYPAFRPAVAAAPVVDAATQTLAEMPQVRSEHDRRAIITRLRFVMEDPAQQLVNAGHPFIVDQLAANGNRPELVRVPGLDGVAYPPRSGLA